MERKSTYRISDELLKAARIRAVEAEVSLSEAIRQLLELWVAGEIELAPKEKHPEEE